MKQKKLLNIIIIVVVLLGEFLVWTFPYDKNPYDMAIIGGADGPTAVYIAENENGENLKPDKGVKSSDEDETNQNNLEAANRDFAEIALDKGLLILVNKNNNLEESYKPDDLEPVNYFAEDRSAEGRFLRAEAAEQFNNMALAAREAGHEIVMTTAYRSYGFQSVLYKNYVSNYGQEEADKFSAKPGSSEHQTGLAVDVSAPSAGYALTQDFDKTTEWKWLAENAEKFGFVLRYPKGKTEITGYMYEPWHFRYVGTDIAKTMNNENITLEEYINKYLN